jgi:hypothetical protein
MSTTVAGFLSVQDASGVLNTSPIAVRRLIARGRLKATRLKSKDSRPGEWSILSIEMEKYIGSGAQDLLAPPIDAANDGSSPSWFSDRLRWQADRLTSELIALASEQPISAEGFSAAVAANGPGETIRKDVALTSAMRSALGGPVDPSAPKMPGATEPDMTWFALWAGVKLHDAAQAAIRSNLAEYGMQPPLFTLYDSPEQYRQIVDAAAQRVAGGQFFVYSEHRQANDRNGQAIPVRIEYRLSVASYAATKAIQLVAESAF